MESKALFLLSNVSKVLALIGCDYLSTYNFCENFM